MAQSGASVLLGVAFAVLPILWIVVPALCVHKLCVSSGQFELIRSKISPPEHLGSHRIAPVAVPRGRAHQVSHRPQHREGLIFGVITLVLAYALLLDFQGPGNYRL